MQLKIKKNDLGKIFGCSSAKRSRGVDGRGLSANQSRGGETVRP